MPVYLCDKCNCEFETKSSYDRHLKRKFPCKGKVAYDKNGNISEIENTPHLSAGNPKMTPTVIRDNLVMNYSKSVPQNMVSSEFDIEKSTYLSSSSSSTSGIKDYYEHTKKMSNDEKLKNPLTLKCSYCSSLLKNRISLNRHLKICKFIPLTKADLDKVESKLSHKINSTLTTISDKNAQIINNTINTTTNNNNNTQNIIYVDNRGNSDKPINLKAFGSEQLDYLTKDLMKNIISRPETGIIKLIEHVHFNKEQPENQNIHISNKKDPYVDVFNGKIWEKQDKKIAIQNMITTKKDIMDDYFDEQVEKNIITSFIRNSYTTFSDLLDEYIRKSLTEYDEDIKKRVARKCHRLYREIFKSAELLLIKNKTSIPQSLENIPSQSIADSSDDDDDD